MTTIHLPSGRPKFFKVVFENQLPSPVHLVFFPLPLTRSSLDIGTDRWKGVNLPKADDVDGTTPAVYDTLIQTWIRVTFI